MNFPHIDAPDLTPGEKVNISDTGPHIGFLNLNQITDDVCRIEVLRKRNRRTLHTRIRLDYFHESTLEIWERNEFDLPDWAEPLEIWRGLDVSEQTAAYLCFTYELSNWQLMISAQHQNSADALQSRELAAETGLMLALQSPGKRAQIIELLHQVRVNRKKFFKWPGLEKKNHDEDFIVVTALHDSLLRKYTLMTKKQRFAAMRSQIDKLPTISDDAIDKILDRNKKLREVFATDPLSFVRKRNQEIEGEVNEYINRLKKHYRIPPHSSN